MTPRFWAAMATFGALMALAAITLAGPIRLATLIFLGGLALKTWLATLRHDE